MGSHGVSDHTLVNFLITNLLGMSQVDQVQLGPQFYLFKNRENDSLIFVLKRKRLTGIVIQINRINNHWKTITSE